MKQTKWIPMIAAGILTPILLAPWLRSRFRQAGDDKLKVDLISPFQFRGVDKPLATSMRATINRMGAVGSDAEERYQMSLQDLRAHVSTVVQVVGEELKELPMSRYLDRWSLIQLLNDLRDPASLPLLDTVLSKPMPAEAFKNPHARSSLRQETINLTTAVEAISRLASEGNQQARELLLKHLNHESLSVRRACVQGYAAYGGRAAREKLVEVLPQRDHYLLDIRQVDVGHVPPIRVTASELPDRSKKGVDRLKATTDVPLVPPQRHER